MTDVQHLAAACDPTPEAVGEALRRLVGWRLYTVMALDPARGEAARVHTSHPDAYPVDGRKPLGALTEWGAHVIEGRRSWIGRDLDDLRRAFPDHETIASLGCASCLNVPVIEDEVVLGTVNLLHEARWYEVRHADAVAPFAALLRKPLKQWAEGAYET